MRAYNAADTVIALPFSPMLNAVTMGSPSVAAMAMPASMWAPSRAPTATLSRIVAHEASGESVTSSPWREKKPSSRATTSGAQSVSGMKPSATARFSGFAPAGGSGRTFDDGS